jgi:hypothetical protein
MDGGWKCEHWMMDGELNTSTPSVRTLESDGRSNNGSRMVYFSLVKSVIHHGYTSRLDQDVFLDCDSHEHTWKMIIFGIVNGKG